MLRKISTYLVCKVVSQVEFYSYTVACSVYMYIDMNVYIIYYKSAKNVTSRRVR